MREAIKKLGFAGVDETAIGATIVKREYDRILHEEKRDILISSCCHSINLLIQKYFPSELQYLADVVSPMQAHCLEIKKQNPGCKTVFIGPVSYTHLDVYKRQVSDRAAVLSRKVRLQARLFQMKFHIHFFRHMT